MCAFLLWFLESYLFLREKKTLNWIVRDMGKQSGGDMDQNVFVKKIIKQVNINFNAIKN